MKKQRKLLARAEKAKICEDWNGICFNKSKGLCPLYFEIGYAQFCYKDHADMLKHVLQEIDNDEVEI